MIPLRTSIQPRKTPYLNYGIIAINIVIFLASYYPRTTVIAGRPVQETLRSWTEVFILSPARPQLWQFITYAFLHATPLHIIGNMYFLYTFGNNVNDKMGNTGYMAFYLAGAVFSAVGHMMLPGASPVLGASGAVAAITGAYLVLFPQTTITVLYWFIFIGTWDLPALYFIAFKLIVWDNIIAANPNANVAYNAHLAGYAFGIIVPLALLAAGLIARTNFDLWSMIKQWNRRRKFRDAVSSGYDPFKGPDSAKVRKKVKAKQVLSPDQQAQNEQIIALRAKISTLFQQRNIPSAAQTYLDLLKLDPDSVLPRQNQLDVANQLMADGKWKQSAHAYEKLLSQYPKFQYSDQVYLMLGILYSRYLNEPADAVKYLKLALEQLSDPGQKEMAQSELDKYPKA